MPEFLRPSEFSGGTGVEPLGEPAVDEGEEIAGLGGPYIVS
jgi:hypothetical protein